MPFFDTFFKDKPTALGAWLQDEKARQVLQRLRRSHPQLRRLLEIGPGRGELAALCKGAGLDYQALEPNQLQADALVQQGFEVLLAYVPPIPLQDEQYDAVVALNVLEHMPDFPTAIRFLSEMVRVVRPGGLVCINCPDLMAAQELFWDADYTHNFPVTMRRLQQMFNDQGLKIVDAAFYSGVVPGPLATPLSWAAKGLPEPLLAGLARPLAHPDQIRRFRLTFLRNVFMVGRK